MVLIAIPTTPRYRVPDRDMSIDGRTPPRASDSESIGMLNGWDAPPSYSRVRHGVSLSNGFTTEHTENTENLLICSVNSVFSVVS